MKNRFSNLAPVVALAAALSACAASPLRIAAVQASGSPPHLGTVASLQGCGDDDGGFGAPVRHFGNPTPFSENPFNACWPR